MAGSRRRLDESRRGVPLFFAALLGAALATLLGTTLLDDPDPSLVQPFAALVALGGGSAAEVLSTAAEVTAAVLAIAMTVVAIVVELAANRYSHRIPFLFVREPWNVALLSLFLLTTLQCLWMATLLSDPMAAGDPPLIGFAVTLGMVSLSLLLLLPYFAFVLSFISPLSIVDRIRGLAWKAIRAGEKKNRTGLQHRVLTSVDELQDVSRGAIEQGDRGIAMACIDAMHGLLVDYEVRRELLPPSWFDCEELLREDPDFVSLAPMAMDTMRPIWVEAKVLRQFTSLLGVAASRSRDVANLIGIRTAQMGIAAADPGQENRALLDLCIRCFNSYLRTCVNARDQRTAYYLTNQYRLLAEGLLERGREEEAADIVGHFQYYGVLSHEMGQSFLLEVVAHDIVWTIRRATELDCDVRKRMIDSLLEVDQEIKEESQEQSLLGVRRSQLQLAAFLLERGDEAAAKRICTDFSQEPAARVRRIVADLETQTDPWYHEFTDRAVNLAHLEPALRRHLPTLERWALGA